MQKPILVLYPDGRITALTDFPTRQTLQHLVGGSVEAVRVLERIENTYGIYTYMYVNENGLVEGLPRNEAATVLFQRNVRAAYPGHPDPFGQAERDVQARMAPGTVVVSLAEDVPGYAQDPWIAGVAVYFQGWTCAEIQARYAAEAG